MTSPYDGSIIAEPRDPPINSRAQWQGREVTPDRIVDLYTRTRDQAAWHLSNVVTARDFRRNELTVKLDPSWVDKNPSVAQWAVHVMSERQTIEREQIARVNSVVESLHREPLSGKKADDDRAQAFERYMNEWRLQHLDQKELGIKGTEDGAFGIVVLPSAFDLDGRPDFFDRITEDAYAKLGDDERGSYTEDRSGNRRRPYVKVDERGNKRPKRQYEPLALNDRERSLPVDKQMEMERSRYKKKEAEHDLAVDRYLLQHQASNVRLIPSLDCVPIYGRGTGKDRFRVVALIERSLISVEDAIDAEYGWTGMGSRQQVPRGYNEHRTTGQNGYYYLYTLYCLEKDKQKHCERPLIFYTVGGYGTSFGEGSVEPRGAGSKHAVGMIDLYEEMGLTGSFWGYFGGMRTGDDDPYYRYQSWMFPFIRQILGIEGTTTSIKATVGTSAFPWFNYKPDAKLAEVDDEALLEEGPSGRTLRQPQKGQPGDVVTNAGDISPQAVAQISPDAWKLNASEIMGLKENTATERPSQASGNAIAISETLAQVAQAQIREGRSAATTFAAECHVKILDALCERKKLKWPILTQLKRASGSDKAVVSDDPILRFDPEWLGDEKNTKLTAVLPSEENLARIDLERSLYKDRLASFADVQTARGKEDPEEVRLEIAKDLLWEDPANQLLFQQRVAEITGNRKMQAVLKLKASGAMQDGGSVAPGIPSSMLRRKGEQGGEQGGAPMASSVRGGIMAGQVQTAQQQQAVGAAIGAPSPGVAA